MNKPDRSPTWKTIHAVLFLGISLYFFFLPALCVIGDLNDPALYSGAIPKAAWRLHEKLAPAYANWARNRIASQRAKKMNNQSLSGSEWPPFGSVFYLWSLESLQQSWEADPSQAAVAPAIYARPAIEAAADLVVDPNHATWVRKWWGDNYLHKQDLFYRYLLISAMTSYSHLTGNPRLLDQLRDQVETLSAEIDSSRWGLLNDYPGQCYPPDVIATVMCIKRADVVLKTDHSAFIKRALRGLQPPHADAYGLPFFQADLASGSSVQDSRGSGNSYTCICAPEIWPEQAKTWYQDYEKNFWQYKLGIAGFRELPAGKHPDNTLMEIMRDTMDMDAGPVIFGLGTAASAFGVGAARANGRMDHAGPLTAEMIATCCPLATGTLLLPRMLSDGSDAPYLGETGVLYCLTRLPVNGIQKTCSSAMTPFVYVALAFYFLMAGLFATPFVKLIRSWRRGDLATAPSKIK